MRCGARRTKVWHPLRGHLGEGWAASAECDFERMEVLHQEMVQAFHGSSFIDAIGEVCWL